jgi:hypothetical protein
MYSCSLIAKNIDGEGVDYIKYSASPNLGGGGVEREGCYMVEVG